MGIVFVFICMYVLYISVTAGGGELNTPLKCHEKKEPHKWIEKEQDGNIYMVCEVCKELPGEGSEEG